MSVVKEMASESESALRKEAALKGAANRAAMKLTIFMQLPIFWYCTSQVLCDTRPFFLVAVYGRG